MEKGRSVIRGIGMEWQYKIKCMHGPELEDPKLEVMLDHCVGLTASAAVAIPKTTGTFEPPGVIRRKFREEIIARG